MMHIISSIIVGLIVGALARFLYPGAVSLSIPVTILLGIAGSFVGGLIGRLFSKPQPGTPFHPAGFFMSLVGALVILFVYFRLVNHV